MKVLTIEWADAYIDTDDFTVEEAKEAKPCYRTTVGWLVAKNQYGYVLATDRYREEKEGVAGQLFIPHGVILKVEELYVV